MTLPKPPAWLAPITSKKDGGFAGSVAAGDAYGDGTWLDSDLGWESVSINGGMSAAALRQLADYMDAMAAVKDEPADG